MLATFATLIVLVQHISTMLQAPNIAAAAGADLLDVLDAANAEDGEHANGGTGVSENRANSQDPPEILVESTGYPLRVRDTGYIQFIDPETLLTLGREQNLVVRMLRRPGHFVWPGTVVALIWPADRVNAQLEKLVRRAVQIGNGRTPTQDIVYAINQLTEMAVRAMSPAINDPFTAMTCLDHMSNGLVRFIQQGEPDARYYDGDGKLRLVLESAAFAELLDAAFDMLRHASCDNASVLLHMLKTIEAIGQAAQAPAARQELLRHVSLIQAESQAGNLIEQDRQHIALRSEALILKFS
jgi:uncharacterized membrane protein